MRSYPTNIGPWRPLSKFTIKSQTLTAALLSLSFFGGCNFRPAPSPSSTSEQNSASVPLEDLEGRGGIESPCAPGSEHLNLTLTELSPEALPYLERYSIPTTDETEFCRYLERLRQEHEAKIDEGLIDMMGDYFWSTQTVETNYYFSYQLSGRADVTPQIILDRASSEDEMVERFMRAIDDDPDVQRRALFDGFIQTLSSADAPSRKDGVQKLMNLIFEKSWIFDPEFQQSAKNANRDDTYNFVERGLRTTTPIIIAALVDRFINSDTGKEFLPEQISRILIIGPGLQFSSPDVGPTIAQESHEPFTLMDSLLRSGKATFEEVEIDLLDINQRVVEHFRDAAGSGEPYELHIVMNTDEDRGRAQLGVFDYGRSVLGSSLPGVDGGLPLPGKSLRPRSGTLDPAETISRSLQIPADIVAKLHSFQGDMTTTDLEKLASADGEKYDVVFCFNTLVYLTESERSLAGINIRKALAENGVFVTDNRFETEAGGDPLQEQSAGNAAGPIFDTSFFEIVADYNEDGSNMGPVEAEGRRTIVYRRGQSLNGNN